MLIDVENLQDRENACVRNQPGKKLTKTINYVKLNFEY